MNTYVNANDFFAQIPLNNCRIDMDLNIGKKWGCSTCTKTFKTYSDLTKHIVTYDPDAKVKCEVSVYKFQKVKQILQYKYAHLSTSVQ